MKFLILIFTVFAVSIQVLRAQQSNPASADNTSQHQFYIKKQKTNNTIGYVCLATGLTVGLVGAIEIAGEGVMKHTDSYKSHASATFAAGNVIALASIPFFIIAHNDKKKASLSVGRDAIIINDKSLPNTGYTKLTLTVRL